MTEFMKSDHQELNNLFSNEELSALNNKVEESYYQQQTESPATEPVIKPETSQAEVKPEEVKPVSTPVTEEPVQHSLIHAFRKNQNLPVRPGTTRAAFEKIVNIAKRFLLESAMAGNSCKNGITLQISLSLFIIHTLRCWF